MFQPSREQVRRFFIAAWRSYRLALPLQGLEALAVEHILRHPEYQGLLEAGDEAVERDWLPEMGETNPFLHLSMHLSISEQLSIDQPVGMRACYAALAARLGDEHSAQHAVMDCLAEMMWQAQRHHQPPDGQAYLDCLTRKGQG